MRSTDEQIAIEMDNIVITYITFCPWMQLVKTVEEVKNNALYFCVDRTGIYIKKVDSYLNRVLRDHYYSTEYDDETQLLLIKIYDF